MHPYLSSIIQSLFPPVCCHCQREGAWLCESASKQLSAVSVLLRPIQIPHVDLVICRGSYDHEVLASIVQKIKYSGWSAASVVLADLLKPLRTTWNNLPPETVIIPVPLHKKRQAQRGFNQALLIAAALSGVSSYPVRSILERRRTTRPQAQLNERDRAANVAGAFVLKNRVASLPNSAILVDDVITTGATVQACAAVLRQNGVQHITAVTLAKG